MRLISYKYMMLAPFGDGEYRTIYELELEKTYLFGLFKRILLKKHEVSMFSSISETEKHWDVLIKNRTKIK